MTRRLLILVALSTGLWGLAQLGVGLAEPSTGLVTAIAGLALLSALTLGGILERFGIPAITAYAMVGLAAGPATGLWAVGDWENGALIRDTALALLVFQLASRRDGGVIRTHLGSAIPLTLITGFWGFTATWGAALLLVPVHPDVPSNPQMIGSLALLLAGLSLSSSPTIMGHVIATSNAKGPLANRGFGLALARGCLMVLVVALGLGINALDYTPLLSLLLWSAAVGLGIFAIVRVVAAWLGRGATWPLLILIATLLPLFQSLPANPVLAFSIAGLGVRLMPNASARLHIVSSLRDLRLAAVLLVFTAIGGQLEFALDLGLLVIVGLFLSRAVGLWLGVNTATRWLKDAPAMQRVSWLYLLPQGALTLGVLEVVASLSPKLAPVLNSVIYGSIGLSLLIAPATLRLSLRLADEIEPDPEPAFQGEVGMVPLSTPEFAPTEWRDPLQHVEPPRDVQLVPSWQRTREGLIKARGAVISDAIDGRLRHVNQVLKTSATMARQVVQNAGEALGRLEDTEAARRELYACRAHLASVIRNELSQLEAPASVQNAELARPRGLLDIVAGQVAKTVRLSPAIFEVREAAWHTVREPERSGWVNAVRQLKDNLHAVRSLFGRARPTRTIPYRRLVRRTLAGELVASLGPVDAMVSRAEYKGLRRIEAHVTAADDVLVEALAMLSEDQPLEQLREWLQERVAELKEASREAQADISTLGTEPARRLSEAMAAALTRLTFLTSYAGTFEVTENDIRYAKVAPQVRDALEEAAKTRKQWSRRQRAQLDRIALDLQLIGLQVGLREAVLNKAMGPAVRMHARVGELMSRAYELVSESRQRTGELAEKGDVHHATTEVRSLLDALQRRVARPLEELIQGLRAGAMVDRLLTALENATSTLPVHLDLLPESTILSLERGRPTSGEPVPVEVQDIARRFFDRRVAVTLAEHSRALETSAEEARAGIRDAKRLLSLQLSRVQPIEPEDEASTTVEGNEGEAVGIHRLTLESLDTIQERLQDEINQTRDTASALLTEIAQTESEAVEGLWKRLHDIADLPAVSHRVTGLRRYLERILIELRQSDNGQRIERGLAQLLRTLSDTSESAAASGMSVISGPTAVLPALQSLDPYVRDLPYVYGKLFSVGPTENDAFILGRDEELRVLRERLTTVEHGALAVIGERGSGRTSILRTATGQLDPSRSLIWLETNFTLNSTDDVLSWLGGALGLKDPEADLITLELRQGAPVVLLDGLERMIVRNRTGLEALALLADLIVSTSAQVCWVVSIEKTIWNLLNGMSPLEDAFDTLVTLRPLDHDAIRSAVIRRHRLSGLEIAYSPPSGLDTRRIIEAVSRLSNEERYFRRLWMASHGNPRLALQLWQLCLEQDGQTARQLNVNNPHGLRLPELNDLPEHLNPALSMAYLHGVVDRESLECALGWTATEARAALHALELSGLLHPATRAHGEQGWELVPHAQGSVEEHLISRGLKTPRGGIR